MNNNNQQQQQQDTNQNNVSANLNDTDPNISNISDFYITNDPSLHAVSSRQFEQQIGDEDQINRDFNMLDFHTDQSHYDQVVWRSSPVPRNAGQNAAMIHEYSGNVSYNDILTESESNTSGSLNVSDEYFVLNSLELDMPIQQQQQQQQRQSPPPAPPSSPTQSGDEFIIIDSLEHDDE